MAPELLRQVFLPPVNPLPAPQSPVNLRDARKDNPPSPFVLEHAAIAPGTEHLRGFTPASWQGFWTRGASRGRRRRIERPEGRRDFPGPAAPRGSEAGAEPSRCAVPHATWSSGRLGPARRTPSCGRFPLGEASIRMPTAELRRSPPCLESLVLGWAVHQ